MRTLKLKARLTHAFLATVKQLFVIGSRARGPNDDDVTKHGGQTLGLTKHTAFIYSEHILYLTFRLRDRVFHEQILNKAQLRGLSLIENEGE